MNEIHKNIKQIRLERGLSQEELAEKMGYTSRSTIAKIESGKNDIPQSKIKAFADALSTTPSRLLGLDSETLLSMNDADTDKILKLANLLNNDGKRKTIDYMKLLSSNPDFSKKTDDFASPKNVVVPIAARGNVSQNKILTKEEYERAENTKFNGLKPKKQLPKF